MKKLILSVLLALATVAGANAQTLIASTNSVNKTRSVGDDAKFKVELTDFAKSEKASLTYQWFGSVLPFGFFQPITDQTNRVLNINSVTTDDPAYFFVRVSDGTTTEISPLNSLTVTQDGQLIVQVWSPDGEYPVVTLLGQQTVLSVKKAQDHPNGIHFQWYKVDGSGNQTIIPGATSKDYVIPSTQISDVSFYTVVATKGDITEQPPELYDLQVEVVE